MAFVLVLYSVYIIKSEAYLNPVPPESLLLKYTPVATSHQLTVEAKRPSP